MNTDGFKKLDRLLFIMKLFQQEKKHWRVKEIVERLGFSFNEDTIGKDLKELSYTGLLPITDKKRIWILPEKAIVPKLDISLSYAEAGALYLAGRLLAQTQDEQNWHVSMALKKLVDALPAKLQEQQKTFLDLLTTPAYQDEDEHDATKQLDLSQTFQVLTSSWLTRRQIKIAYQPPNKRGFDCHFEPYLLEPSAIGRTIYAIGWSSIANGLRTFKLERIQKAEPTETQFEIPANFNGPELLRHAWGVMYGDEEPITVRLRFSHTVTKRVRETRWHPSQRITLTRDGCEWMAVIGDIMEIEPWIRGWGSDCEVLEPLALRERVIQHLRRSMAIYKLGEPEKPATQNPLIYDLSLFRKQNKEQ
jgi:predicted DNA-binding transcriptional regulator YafY